MVKISTQTCSFQYFSLNRCENTQVFDTHILEVPNRQRDDKTQYKDKPVFDWIPLTYLLIMTTNHLQLFKTFANYHKWRKEFCPRQCRINTKYFFAPIYVHGMILKRTYDSKMGSRLWAAKFFFLPFDQHRFCWCLVRLLPPSTPWAFKRSIEYSICSIVLFHLSCLTLWSKRNWWMEMMQKVAFGRCWFGLSEYIFLHRNRIQY